MAEYIAGELTGIEGVSVRLDKAASHVYVKLSAARSASERDQIKNRLLAGEPRVIVRDSGHDGIRVNAGRSPKDKKKWLQHA
jgi:hypothetical protein